MIQNNQIMEFRSANKVVFGLNAAASTAEEVATEQFNAEGCDLVIGFGGGSSLDTAKAVSLMATNGTDFEEMLGYQLVKKRGVPKISVSTTNNAGADIGLAIVTVTDLETHEHGMIISDFAIPDVVINDPLLTVSMPKSVTADTGIDVLVTGIESLVSKTATPFSDMYAEKVIEICGKYLPRVCAKGGDIEARSQMAMAATMSGIAYMSSMLGAVHGLSYPIAGHLELSHGRSMAPLLPHVMRANIPGNAPRFALVADLLGYETIGLSDLEAAEMAADAVEKLLDVIGVSYRLRDYGAKKEDLPSLAQECLESLKSLDFAFDIPNPIDVTLEDVKEILENAY
ncbi:MAG: iron-containing alcohol dehydrogenase [Deltaproteobacteria bacterium]|nr:iron-containing alcohol dehydrogenase [Deltaproteobacteria bacterium]